MNNYDPTGVLSQLTKLLGNNQSPYNTTNIDTSGLQFNNTGGYSTLPIDFGNTGLNANNGGGIFGSIGDIIGSDGFKTGLNFASGAAQSYLGLKQLGLAEDQFDFQKQAYADNYDNQRTLTNQHINDRHASRQAYDSSSFQSLPDLIKARG